MQHFDQLRSRINAILDREQSSHALAQVSKFPWLYGAIGQVPSEIMFVCENPSFAGVEAAHVETIDGGPPDIEAQWWGGPRNPAATRFRCVLCELGLKTNGVAERGGWNCYITNVIKAANVAKEQSAIGSKALAAQAQIWAPVLAWEMERVAPRHLFCVGGKAAKAVKLLQKERLIPRVSLSEICHYSARGSHEKVRSEMLAGIRQGLQTLRARA